MHEVARPAVATCSPPSCPLYRHKDSKGLQTTTGSSLLLQLSSFFFNFFLFSFCKDICEAYLDAILAQLAAVLSLRKITSHTPAPEEPSGLENVWLRISQAPSVFGGDIPAWTARPLAFQLFLFPEPQQHALDTHQRALPLGGMGERNQFGQR